MARTRKLTVEILGDASSLSKAFRQIGSDTDSLKGKMQAFSKKALVPATLAFGALAAAGMQAVNAAVEDAKAQAILAGILRNTIKATDAQVASVEEYIAQQGKLLGITDDELRPAFASIIRVTKDVTKAQEILAMAYDISAGTGKDLGSVTDALAKAYGGNMRGLRALSPELFQMIKDGAALEDVMAKLAETFGGQAAAQAETAAGKIKIAQVRFDEFREALGSKLLPIITDKLIPVFEKIIGFMERNEEVVLIAAAAIGVFSAAFMVLNAVMYANPVVLIVAAVAALIAALVIAYQRFEGFRNVIDTVFSFIKSYFAFMVDAIKGYISLFVAVWSGLGNAIKDIFTSVKDFVLKIFDSIIGAYKGVINAQLGALEWLINQAIKPINLIIDGVNLVNPFADIPKLKDIDIPQLATGGLVMSPTLALVGEAGPEAVVPLDRMGDMGGGDVYNITVQAGLVSSPQQVGQDIIQAILRAQRANGAVFATV